MAERDQVLEIMEITARYTDGNRISVILNKYDEWVSSIGRENAFSLFNYIASTSYHIVEKTTHNGSDLITYLYNYFANENIYARQARFAFRTYFEDSISKEITPHMDLTTISWKYNIIIDKYNGDKELMQSDVFLLICVLSTFDKVANMAKSDALLNLLTFWYH